MKIPDIEITVHNGFVELQALMTEREGMIAENVYCVSRARPVPYGGRAFKLLTEKMRALQTSLTKEKKDAAVDTTIQR